MSERATLALGCFWGSEAKFACVKGILKTRVGYTGGTPINPTYHHLSDHIEAVDLLYNPKVITFSEILKIFWSGHDPSWKPSKRQYISAIFYNNDEQKLSAEKSLKEAQKLTKKTIVTEIIAGAVFYNAEHYHQKYFLRKHKSLLGWLKLSDAEIIDSPIAARLNGFVAGFGSVKQFDEESAEWGVRPVDADMIRDIIRAGPNLGEC